MPEHNFKAASLDQKFWTHFSKNNWEKKPLSLKNINSPLQQIDPAEIFRLLVLLSDRCRKLNDASGFKFYINGTQTHPEDVLQVLPIKKDKSLLGYHQRMKLLFSDYCLVCDELLQANTDKLSLITDFTDELYRHVGFPNRFSEMGLYLGNYRKTPFGVHVDNCGVFSFPIIGKKKFRLWTSAFVKKNPALNRTFSYNKYKKNSQVLEAEAGDMTYWPSSAWHIAESDGAFSATWSLGVWVDKTHHQLFSNSLALLLKEKFGARGNLPTAIFKELHKATGEVTLLPVDFQKSIAKLRDLTTAELEDVFLKSWMQHISILGLKNIPTGNLKITLASQIKLRNSCAKILWLKRKSKNNLVCLSFGGIQIETKKSKRLLNFISSINAGELCQVSKYANKKDLSILQQLADAGAFQ